MWNSGSREPGWQAIHIAPGVLHRTPSSQTPTQGASASAGCQTLPCRLLDELLLAEQPPGNWERPVGLLEGPCLSV